jgi:hypothetical protein
MNSLYTLRDGERGNFSEYYAQRERLNGSRSSSSGLYGNNDLSHGTGAFYFIHFVVLHTLQHHRCWAIGVHKRIVQI